MNCDILLCLLCFVLLTATNAYFFPKALGKVAMLRRTASISIHSTAIFPRKFLQPHFAQPKAARSTGKVAVLEKQKLKEEQAQPLTDLKAEIEKNWRLILHDDPVHTVEEVVRLVAEVNFVISNVSHFSPNFCLLIALSFMP
jgi:hypothetical protein